MTYGSYDNDGADQPLLPTPPTKPQVTIYTPERKWRIHLGISFFLFGLINNIFYIVILSAALDLVPPSTPKGVVTFCNIAPAFAVGVVSSWLLKGRIQYARRLLGCCACSVTGMLLIACCETVGMRLFGIALTSLASGLAELSFLQLSTTYPVDLAASSFGYYASGGGAAGVGGAVLWWEVRRFGVKTGIGLSGALLLVMPLTYFILLPPTASFDRGADPDTGYGAIHVPAASPMDTPADEDQENYLKISGPPSTKVSLSAADKWRLIRPLLLRFMLPLFCVITIEYTINQGITPTLMYPVPEAKGHWILHRIITDVRDYYPLWQLVYQTSIFVSRSTLSLGLPALPLSMLKIPAIIQLGTFAILAAESAVGIFPRNPSVTMSLISILVAVEGFCGGLTYVNVLYRLGQQARSEEADDEYQVERKKQEREFMIGSSIVGVYLGIVLASLLAMPTEIGLCRAQVARGIELCRTL